MKFQIVATTVRSITVELINDEIYRTKQLCEYYLNGEKVLSSKDNVVSLFGLTPNTAYELTVDDGRQKVTEHFTTKEESVLLNVKKFGATGDGSVFDTGAIQAAILACPPGGTVYLPKGTYLTTPLFLKSNMTLWLDREATLLGTTDRRLYPILPGMVRGTNEQDEYNFGSWEGNPLDSFASLITAIDAAHVDIIGEGTLDGNAQNGDWWDSTKKKRTAWRPNTVFFSRCSDMCLQGLQIQNSPCWTIHPYYSDHLKFLSLSVQNPYDSPNTDGFDPESCSDILMLGTRISVGDDCIAIKSGKYYMSRFHYRRTSNITIRNCKFERGHGSVTIGSEVACGVEHVKVSQCIFEETDRGIRLKTRRGRGETSYLNDLEFDHICMNKVHMPMTVNMFYFCDPDGHSDYVQNQDFHPVDELTPKIGRIRVSNVAVEGADASLICAYGLPEMPIECIEVDHVTASFLPEAERTAQVPIMMDDFPEMSGKSFYFHNVNSVIMKDVKVTGSSDTTPELIAVQHPELDQVIYA